MAKRPYTQKLRAEKTAVTRDQILSAAREQLSRADQLGVREIADEAGVSVQTLYSHFGSRVGLLSALINKLSQESGLFEGIERVWRSQDGEAALRMMLGVTLQFWDGYKEFLEFSLRARRSDPELETHFRRLDDSRLHHLVVICSRLKEERRLRGGFTPETAARLASSLSSPYVYEELVMRGGLPAKAAERMVVDAVVDAVLRQGSKPTKSASIDWSKFGLKPPVT